ncbi:hypothetical protein EVB87_134 [Rhizobium phage RHph_N28_1]|nr:hypothetical protein EVB87_134 [Rhizobium phage RHph_N28_1]QIG74163.1 hypothetical protein EVC07_135 [Rhizobium phage RHph_N42]QIG74769.1 hypothetical protein EVC12_134 [Rhizobium phage RHph_I42]
MQREITQLRTSHGDLTSFKQIDIQLARGEDEEFVFDRVMYAWIRDITNVEISALDENGDVVGVPLVFSDVVGMISWPAKAKIKLSVPADSTISLERVIKLVYS